MKEYEAERKYGYSWNVIDIALYKISYFAQPQGQLMNDLDKAVDDMDKELPVAELVTKGKAFLERLLAMPREELARDLYFVDTLVSAKRRSSLNNVQENFKEVYKEAARMPSKRRTMNGARCAYSTSSMRCTSTTTCRTT